MAPKRDRTSRKTTTPEKKEKAVIHPGDEPKEKAKQVPVEVKAIDSIVDDENQSKGDLRGWRDENGRFAPGHHFSRLPKSINGSSICKYRAMMAEHVPEAIAFVKAVMDGTHKDMPLAEKQIRLQAAKSLIEYVVPAPKASTYIDIEIDAEKLKTLTGTKEEAINVIKQLEGANCSVESVAAATAVLQDHIKFIEAADIEPRMREIEQAIHLQRNKG